MKNNLHGRSVQSIHLHFFFFLTPAGEEEEKKKEARGYGGLEKNGIFQHLFFFSLIPLSASNKATHTHKKCKSCKEVSGVI